jgi:C1A family cysteine protease
MCGGGIKRLPNGELAILMMNSWGTQWGQDGFCWLTRAHIEGGTWFECFWLQAVIRDPLDAIPQVS